MTVSYHTINGQIIGETVGATRTHFLTGGQGSVTATVSDGGLVQNTYRFKSFGGLLAKTGLLVDPQFLWMGDTGIRVSPNSPGDYFFHANLYLSQLGSFSSGRGAYGFNPQSPPPAVTGVVGHLVNNRPPYAHGCGPAMWNIYWVLVPGPPPRGTYGVVYQIVDLEYKVYDCNSLEEIPSQSKTWPTYTEIWELQDIGGVYSGWQPPGCWGDPGCYRKTEWGWDHFSYDADSGKCTFGYVSWKAHFGWKGYYDHTKAGYKWSYSHPSRGLWYLEGIDPGLPSDPQGDHSFTRTWNCCVKGAIQQGGSAWLTQELGKTASVEIKFEPGVTEGCC